MNHQLQNEISFTTREAINQMDPRLDLNWQHQLQHLLERLNQPERKATLEYIFNVHKIIWNKQTQSFSITPPR